MSPQSAKHQVVDYARSLNIDAIGFADVAPVDTEAIEHYRKWLNEKKNADMAYLERYDDIRSNPSLLLEGARTIIVIAVNYYPSTFQDKDNPQFAYYAYGRDYHEVLRDRLSLLSRFITENFGGSTRGCVDTAPIRERYWAVKAGVGFIGRNALLIIPGKGSFFFLGELLTTFHFPPDEPCATTCCDCHACLNACPGKALDGNCRVDANRCLSYLTIEHRGDLPDSLNLGNHLYGCDVCQRVCPHNRHATPTSVAELAPSADFLALNSVKIENMTPQQFSRVFSHSAVKRAKLEGLKRNLRHLNKKNK